MLILFAQTDEVRNLDLNCKIDTNYKLVKDLENLKLNIKMKHFCHFLLVFALGFSRSIK